MIRKTSAQAGVVYLVGAGPGDPELLTVKACRLIASAEVIFYDRLLDKEVLTLAPEVCELVYVGKRKHLHAMRQEDIARRMVERAAAGFKVVRLKGGDPFVFGRGGEEVAALHQAGIAVEVVPGITAATGAAASNTLPLTHRDSAHAVTLVTAHKRHGHLDLDWDLVSRPGQTVVFYMGFSVLADLVTGLLATGVPGETRFSIISRATYDDERVLHAALGDMPAPSELEQLEAPALLILHNTPDGIVAADRHAAGALSGFAWDRALLR
ncbi:MAG: uroporphyrinogen-III C-methyltransferase [Pseudomonadota bacterium]